MIWGFVWPPPESHEVTWRVEGENEHQLILAERIRKLLLGCEPNPNKESRLAFVELPATHDPGDG